MQWYDWMRLATIVCILISGYRMNRIVVRDWKTYSASLRDYVWVVYAFLFFLFAASIEGIVQDLGYGWRIPLGLMVSLVALKATRDVNRPIKL